MTNNKEKYAFWLTPEAKKMVESDVALGNCGSQSELVEKAVRFYDGYLKAQNAGAFLPHAVADVLEGTLGVFANRMAKLLFNLAVEHNCGQKWPGWGCARRHPFLLLYFRRTEKLPDTLPNGPGGIRTLPPPCEATNRPTGGNTAGNGREMRCGWKFPFPPLVLLQNRNFSG